MEQTTALTTQEKLFLFPVVKTKAAARRMALMLQEGSTLFVNVIGEASARVFQVTKTATSASVTLISDAGKAAFAVTAEQASEINNILSISSLKERIRALCAWIWEVNQPFKFYLLPNMTFGFPEGGIHNPLINPSVVEQPLPYPVSLGGLGGWAMENGFPADFPYGGGVWQGIGGYDYIVTAVHVNGIFEQRRLIDTPYAEYPYEDILPFTYIDYGIGLDGLIGYDEFASKGLYEIPQRQTALLSITHEYVKTLDIDYALRRNRLKTSEVLRGWDLRRGYYDKTLYVKYGRYSSAWPAGSIANRLTMIFNFFGLRRGIDDLPFSSLATTETGGSSGGVLVGFIGGVLPGLSGGSSVSSSDILTITTNTRVTYGNER